MRLLGALVLSFFWYLTVNKQIFVLSNCTCCQLLPQFLLPFFCLEFLLVSPLCQFEFCFCCMFLYLICSVVLFIYFRFFSFYQMLFVLSLESRFILRKCFTCWNLWLPFRLLCESINKAYQRWYACCFSDCR